MSETGVATRDEGSVFWGMVWMALLSLLLIWLPLVGGLIAGIVGGKVAGSVGRGIAAALLPSLLLGAALFLFGTALTGLPVVGFIAGMGGLVLALSCVGPLLVGAIIGGLTA